MTTANVTKSINAPIESVWPLLSDFAAIQVGGPIESVTYEGEGVGMIRTLGMGGGQVVERLDTWDAQTHTFSYSILNDDSPLPFLAYSAKVILTDNGDNTCTVNWTGSFEVPQGTPEDTAINTATGIYAGAIKGAKQALGV